MWTLFHLPASMTANPLVNRENDVTACLRERIENGYSVTEAPIAHCETRDIA